MNKNDILDYVMNTPGNTNRAVLNSMLNSLEGSEGGSVPDGPTFNDGKTRLFITIPGLDRPVISIYFGCTVVGGVTIDWGDGSETEVTTSTERTRYSHSYSAAGDYIIALEVTDGELVLEGGEDDSGYRGITQAFVDEGNPYTLSYNWSTLKMVEIGSGVTSIGDYAFYECYALNSIVIPEGVTSIGDFAFYECTALASVVISEGVTSIGDFAFYECYALSSIAIPSSITSIGQWAFYNCTALASVVISEGVTSIGDYAFSNCSTLTSITIPSSVTSIEEYAFSGCRALASVVIPEGVISIGDHAFDGCSTLTSVTIPSSVTSIGDGAFRGCRALTSVTIPEGVTSIKNETFMECSSIGGIHLSTSTPPAIAAGSFGSVPDDCKIYVPEGSLEAYSTAANWSDYTSMLRVEGAEPGVA